MNPRSSITLLSMLTLTIVPAAAHAAPMLLTAMNIYSIDDHDGPAFGQEWNTTADGEFNVYLRSGPAWLNAGNAADLNVTLTPGVHTFQIWGDHGTMRRYALSLMFDGANDAPRIAAATTADSPDNAFTTIGSGPLVLDLLGAARPSPDSIIYADSTTQVTLTRFSWFNATFPAGDDLVAPFDNTPDTVPDNHGTLELTVTTVPAPAAFPALITVTTLLTRRRRSRHEHARSARLLL